MFQVGKIKSKIDSGETGVPAIYILGILTLGQFSCCLLSCFDSPQQEISVLGSVLFGIFSFLLTINTTMRQSATLRALHHTNVIEATTKTLLSIPYMFSAFSSFSSVFFCYFHFVCLLLQLEVCVSVCE